VPGSEEGGEACESDFAAAFEVALEDGCLLAGERGGVDVEIGMHHGSAWV